ncbi:hypothetical protein Lser_V15G00566 [Lactuca serriola]
MDNVQVFKIHFAFKKTPPTIKSQKMNLRVVKGKNSMMKG